MRRWVLPFLLSSFSTAERSQCLQPVLPPPSLPQTCCLSNLGKLPLTVIITIASDQQPASKGKIPAAPTPFISDTRNPFFFPQSVTAGQDASLMSIQQRQSSTLGGEIAGSKLSSWNCIWKIGSWVLRGNQVLSFSVSSYSFSFSYYWNCFYIKRGLQNQKRNWFCICYLWVDTF